MNCLPEAIGLALPWQRDDPRPHTARRTLFREGRRPGGVAGQGGILSRTTSRVPRSIASMAAFENAMALAIARAGRQTILPPCSRPRRGRGWTSAQGDRRASLRVQCQCKVAPPNEKRKKKKKMGLPRGGRAPGGQGSNDPRASSTAPVLNRSVHTCRRALSAWRLRDG